MYDVIVVGCGASGIAALRRLHDAGVKAVGLEAADRIGGRILTVAFGESVVDIGAAWCHGEKDNVVFELANPHNLLGRPDPDIKWFIRSDGEVIPNEVSEKVVSALGEEVAKADKKNDTSISECVRNAAKSNPTLLKNPELTASVTEWFERNCHVGGQLEACKGKSLRGLEEALGCEGEFMLNWKGRGYKTILDLLLNKYPDSSKQLPIQVLLNKEVETIKWKSKEESLNPLVQVKCKDGSLFAAKSVIVTVSTGVLQERHTQLFDPALPSDKVTSINTLQLAVLDKIYIEFDKPWWPKNSATFTILWRKEDKGKFLPNESWITEIYGLQTVDYQPNVLLAWIYGEGAKKMEQCTEEQVKNGVEKVLCDILRGNFKVSAVKNILRSKWASNPQIRGAYAYRSVETERSGGSATSLSEPVYNCGFPVLCFGGEASSHHRHSAVHGAVEAGFREADRLIQLLKK